MTRSATLVLVALACASCVNLHTVVRVRFYRSGQPPAEMLARWIEKYDLATVVRLSGGGPGDDAYDATYGPTTAAGIAFYHVPLSARRHPSREKLLQLWEIFETADYPMLIHCRAGADRSGLASTIYVLQRTGDLDVALDQLDFFPYLHLGWFGTGAMDDVFEMYRPYHGRMSFPEWARDVYSPPVPDE